MFNSESLGFQKVAYVADYGNFYIVPATINTPKIKKGQHRIHSCQAAFLTQMWRESGRKMYDNKRRTLVFDQH